ncbi:MBL fold metallo-hydrolase [Phenylobacterium sp.]|jgi:cyclase|uniref:MBL fold metallo-hydrolase n=1 Tax=Phenylobacterium sp. TaxID=1871053 RepID=UPI001224004C|nr:MBL fold metallo-hydrolase [Phenylobacterium sp.]THD58983.1 MAG: MBL fold metallo-hydrolase [Phenylobacterium sp.]
MRPFACRLSLAAALSLGVALAAAAQPPAPAAPLARPPLVIKPVKPELFMIVGAGGNTTVRLTGEGVVLVDSKNPGQAIYDELVGDVGTISGGKPIRYLIDTHHHADHTGNNGRFEAAGVKVVGQKNLAAELAKFTPPPNNPTATAPASPDITYDKTYDIKLGGKTVRLLHFTPAHTDGDTIVYFPDLKVIAAGDELTAVAPNLDYVGGASISGWIGALDQVLKLDWDQAIPGHGDRPMTRDEVVAFQGKLRTLLGRAREQVKAGVPKDQLIAAIKWDDLWTFNPTFWSAPGRLDGFYAEASK